MKITEGSNANPLTKDPLLINKCHLSRVLLQQPILGSLHTQLLDLFLILVELLKVILVHVGQIVGLSLIAVDLVTQDTHLHLWLRGITKPAKTAPKLSVPVLLAPLEAGASLVFRG